MKEFLNYCLKRKWISIGCLAIAVMLSIIAKQSYELQVNSLLFDEDKLVGISREDAVDGITVNLRAERDGEVVERQVTIPSRASNEEIPKKENYQIAAEDSIDLEITKALREMGQSQDLNLFLPSEIGDGITVEWSENGSSNYWAIPLMFPILIMAFLFRGEKDEFKKREENETEMILNELPSFSNRLVLLMESGLIYDESLRRIAGSEINNQDGDHLTGIIKKAIVEGDETNQDATLILRNYARNKNINELKRITSIIIDNRRKGTSLIPKLTIEGELLWEKRKKKAEEKGRTAESKLTLPLGIMMISILIITAGPALMQM